MTSIAVGKPLPGFTATSTQGNITPDTLRGRYAVLYFYPKDNTPGCTTESQDFRDCYAAFTEAGCQIIGVSRDTLKSHLGFAEKQNLPFPLIADTDETLCQMFNVMKMKNMYGKQVRGVERSTFLVDPQGLVVREWRGLKVTGHVDDVLRAVQDKA
jgi:peroxiredoxin Q/BCP